MKFIYFLAYRLLSALYLKTFYNPDEFYQSMEVAHRMAFGYGVVTWEWKDGLRSFLYPLFISFAYFLLELVELDKPQYLILVPRLMEGCLQATGDYCFIKFIRKYFGDRTANVTTFFLLSNWFVFTVGVRALTNSVEMSLLQIVLYLYPFVIDRHRSYWQYMVVAAFAFCIRCTCIVVFIPLGLSHLYRDKSNFYKSFKIAILPSLLLLGLSTAVDSYFCNKFVFNSYNFFMFNIVLQGSRIFGTHEFTYYLFPVLPELMNFLLFPFIWQLGVILRRRNDKNPFIVYLISGTFVFSLFVTSLNPHKEERFILPLLPLAVFLASLSVVQWEQWLQRRKVKYARFLIYWLMATCFIVDSMLIIKKARFDGRGRVAVVEMLSESLIADAKLQGRSASVLFLGECYGYPLASSIHEPVTTRYVSCADQKFFMSKPSEWLFRYLTKIGTASDSITHLFVSLAVYQWSMADFTDQLDFTGDMDYESNLLSCYKDDRYHDTLLLRRSYSERETWFEKSNKSENATPIKVTATRLVYAN